MTDIDHFMIMLGHYLKKNKVPLIFISTEAVGKSGYMNWKEIKEVEKYDFAIYWEPLTFT